MPENTLSYYPRRPIDNRAGPFLRGSRMVGLFAVCLLLASMLAPMVLFGGILLLAMSYLARTLRRGRGQRIIAYCQQATSANLPIRPMLEAAALDESPLTRRRLRKVAEHLDAGQTLGEALDAVASDLGRDVVGTISAAERIGRLPHTLARMWAEVGERGRSRERTATILQAYAIYALVAMGVLFVASVVAMSKLAIVMEELKIQVPGSARVVMELSGAVPFGSGLMWPLFDWMPLIFIGLLVFVLALMMWPLALGLFSRRTRWFFEETGIDPLVWYTPFVGGLVRDWGLARVFDFVGDAVANGYGLDRALMEAGPVAGNRVLGRRLETWAAGIAAGKSTEQAARAAKMPRQVVGFMAPVRSGEDLSAALRFLGTHYEYRANRASAIGQALLIPIFVTVIGAFVTLLGLSLFQSMAAILKASGPYNLGGGL